MDIAIREFGSNRSIQHPDGALAVVGRINSSTYTLDSVTERGAVLRVQTLSRYGTRKPEVSWFVVRPNYKIPSFFSSRTAARRAIEA